MLFFIRGVYSIVGYELLIIVLDYWVINKIEVRLKSYGMSWRQEGREFFLGEVI